MNEADKSIFSDGMPVFAVWKNGTVYMNGTGVDAIAGICLLIERMCCHLHVDTVDILASIGTVLLENKESAPADGSSTGQKEGITDGL